MDDYEKQIYDYFTTPEHYETAYDIWQQFPKVQEQLVRGFWDRVKNEMENKVNKEKWKLWYDDFNVSFPKLGFYLRNEHLGVIYEMLNARTYYGVHVYPDKGYSVEEIEESLKDKFSNFSFPRNAWWIARAYVGKDDFSSLDTQRLILPNRAEAIVTAYAERLCTLIEELEPVLEQFKLNGPK